MIRALLCLAVPALAFLGWLPYVLSPRCHYWRLGLSTAFMRPPTTMLHQAWVTVRSLWTEGGGRNSWFCITNAALHPVWLVALAGIGSLCVGVRRGLFLWAAFTLGLLPSIVSEGALPSAHRMLMAFPVLAVAVGCALDRLGKRQ